MKRLTIVLTILAISMIFAQGSYAAMDDRSDRLSANQSSVFSPGYINAAMQKTREIINQTGKNKSPTEIRSDTMKDELSNRVAEDNADKPKLELKKKAGGSGEGKTVIEQKNTAGSEANAAGEKKTYTEEELLSRADVDRNGFIDTTDYILLKVNYGNKAGSAVYNANADIDGNNIVDYNDLRFIDNNFGKNVTIFVTTPATSKAKVILQDIDQNHAPERRSLDRVNYISDSNNFVTENTAKSAFGYANEKIGEFLKNSLISKENKRANDNSNSEPGLVVKIQNSLEDRSALALPLEASPAQDMGLTLKLSNILANPTEDQKQMLEAMTAFLNELNKQEKQAGISKDIKKCADDLLQMVAAVLLTQAIPDLFKEGDVADIKNIFTELNAEKSGIIAQYQDSTKPYYSEMIKELSKNMNILQLKDIISGKMTRDELERIPPNELDKIMQKLRQSKDKSFEEEYMLQQEAKYRKQYIDPNKKIFGEKMKDMMEGFTKRLSKVLESAKK